MIELHPFNLVQMDIQMPKMDEMEATRAIRILDRFVAIRKIPIIVVTAYAMPGDREKFLGTGMNDYITNPVGNEALREIITRIMAEAQGPVNKRPYGS